MDEQSIFLEALEKESPDARAAWLTRVCGDNSELKSRIEALVASHLAANSFLERPPQEFEATVVPESLKSDRTGALEGGLTAAFSEDQFVVIGTAGHSIFKMLGEEVNLSRVALRESKQSGPDPIVRPRSPEMPERDPDHRYQLQGEIARGGMGAILKGRDTDLGRDLAIKVLLDSHKGKPEIVQRFIEEAQIGGQLQHPGIAPVYELGQFSDRRPFFSMKLVKGETFSKLLAERKNISEDRGSFLSIFEQVCQTMAYAHSRGVIHRDLKPANIMVGAFGEVQVMDWGLAKVLSAGGVADERKAHTMSSDHSVIQTLRSKVSSDTPEPFGTVGSHTQFGSVMGTPAYMPPEQALGEIDHLDERADVFGLGAILCEILTGKPPYVGDDGTQIFRLAVRGRLDACFERLDGCGADAELVTLTRQCLSLEPKERPRDAGILAEKIKAYLRTVETRLHAAEVDRAASLARAEEALLTAREHQAAANAERRARRLQLGLAIVVLCVMTVGGMFSVWTAIVQSHLRQNAEMAEQVANSAREAESKQRALAELEKGRAENEQRRAESEKRRSDDMLADMQTERGLQCSTLNQTAAAAMWFAKAATTTPHDLTRQQSNLVRAQSYLNSTMTPVARLPLPLADANAAAFQPKGPLFLTISNGILQIWDWRNEITVPWGEAIHGVTDATWSPDGQMLAVAAGSSRVRVFNANNGTERFNIEPRESVSIIKWSPDATLLALGSKLTEIWKVDGAPERLTVYPHPEGVHGLSFNRAGTQIVTAGLDSQARVFAVGRDASSEALFGPLEHHVFAISRYTTPVFCDDDRQLVTILRAKGMPVRWNLTTNPPEMNTWKLDEAYDRSLQASPDGLWIAAGGGSSAALLSINGNSLQLSQRNHLHHALFHPQSKSLITLGFEGMVRIWPLQELLLGKLPSPEIIPQQNTFASGWFSPDGNALAVISNKQAVIWEHVHASIVASHIAWNESFRNPRVSFDGQLIAPGTLHSTAFDPSPRGLVLRIVRFADGLSAGPDIALAGRLFDSCVCSDNRTAAAAYVTDSAGWFGAYDIATGVQRFAPIQLPSHPTSIAPHPQLPQVAVLCKEGQLLLIDSLTGQVERSLSHDGSQCAFVWSRVMYSPDGKTLVSVTSTDRVYVRDALTGESRFPALLPVLENGPCRAIAISDDSRFLATAVCGKNAAQVWDLQTGQKVGQEMPHSGDFYGLWCVAFTHDGQRLVTGHKDGLIRIWNWQTGKMTGPPLKHPDEVSHITITNDDRHILASPRNSTLHIWDVASGKLAVRFLPELLPVKFTSTSTSIVGGRAVYSEGNRYSILELDELLQPPTESASTLLMRAELATNQTIQSGEQRPLDLEEWSDRWKTFVTLREAPNQTAAQLAAALDAAKSESEQKVISARAIRLHLIEQLVALRPLNARLQLEYIREIANRKQDITPFLPAALAAVRKELETSPDNSHYQLELPALLANRIAPDPNWQILTPVEMTATSGCEFSLLENGAILAKALPVTSDDYTIISQPPKMRITSLKLESMPHPTLPAGGSGHDQAGNFCLTEISLLVKHADGTKTPLPLDMAASDYIRDVDSGTDTDDGPWAVLDGSPDRRWDIYPEVTKPHWLILDLEEPYDVRPDDQLLVRLYFHTPYVNSRLGHFRLSVTDEAHIAEAESLKSAFRAKAFDAHDVSIALQLAEGNVAAVIERLGAADKADTLTLTQQLLLGRAYQRPTYRSSADAKRRFDQKSEKLPRTLLSLYWSAANRLANPRMRAQELGVTIEALRIMDLTQEIETAPDDKKYRARGLLFARTGKWSEAAADLTVETQYSPSNRFCWMLAAPCHLLAGNQTGYRDLCDRMLLQFGSSADVDELESVAKICLLLPQGKPVADLPLEQLRTAIGTYSFTNHSHPWIAAVCGLAAVRTEQYAEAIEFVDKTTGHEPPELLPIINIIRAIAQENLGQHESALTALADAEKLIPADLDSARSQVDLTITPLALLSVGHNMLIAEILRREASQLIYQTPRRQSAGMALNLLYAKSVRAGRWTEAAGFAWQLLDQTQNSTFAFTNAAAVLGLANDAEGIHKLSQRMIEQFQDPRTPEVMDSICKISLHLPGAANRERLPVTPLREALEQGQGEAGFPVWGWACLGLVSYRDRDFTEAIRFCEASHNTGTAAPPAQALAYLIQAMAQAQLNEIPRATETLSKATLLIDKATATYVLRYDENRRPAPIRHKSFQILTI